ncbi:MAG: hypothetical protein NVSMB48_19770 [Marmoricola sp.]
MIQLRRAGVALAAAVLPFGSVLTGGATLAQHTGKVSTKPQIDTSWIELANVSPATIPTKGTIVLSGILHNGSGQTWHHLSVMPETSYDPIQTSSDLDAAAAYDPANVVLGQQLPTVAALLSDLAPNKSTRFTVRIPRSGLRISGGTGAYWLGVVPVSDETHPSTLTARTFLPLLPKANAKAKVNISLVLPLRQSPLRTSNGTLAYPGAFASSLSPEGRLGRIVSFGQSANGRALTWLVDPALLDLADNDANGAAQYAIGAEGTSLPVPTPLPTATSTPTGAPSTATTPTTPSTPAGSGPTNSGTASPSSTASPSGTATPSPTQAARQMAGDWLASVTALLQIPSAATYALPYADPAISTVVASGHTELLATADALASASLAARSLSGSPAVAPVSGQLTQREWSALATGETAFVGPSNSPSSPSTKSGGRTLIVASPASMGAPGPASTTSALNLRQRLLAEAATSIGTATTTNLTVVLPSQWDPGSAAGISSFFTQLTRPWINFTNLPANPSGSVSLSKAVGRVTAKQRAAISAAVQLRATTARLVSVLAVPVRGSNVLARQIDGTALSTVSYDAAMASAQYRQAATRTVASIDQLLAGIRVEGTQFVTLSGSSGVITVALHNGLNRPIRVGLRQVDSPGGAAVTVDSIPPVTLDPGERSTLRVHLSARRVSVQEITLTAVTAKGLPIGTPLTFTLRSSPVGAVIWAVTIAIVLVLVLFVGRRLRRRWRGRQEAR